MAVTWITEADVRAALGLPPSDVTDDAWLADSTAAANEKAWQARQAAGYLSDVETTVPNAAVKQGTVLFAVARYRERGAIDGYASSYDESTVPTGGTWGTIRRLWGTPRPVAV